MTAETRNNRHLEIDASIINFSWLVRLRWGAVLGQLATVLIVDRWMHLHLPLRPLIAIILAEAASNIACALWVRRASTVPELLTAVVLVADVLILTALLSLTGGSYNPFSFLYLVHIALAAVVLRERWTWALTLLSLACFGALFLMPVRNTVDHGDPAMHGAHLQMHLEGVASAFIGYFVQRISRALSAREAELRDAREIRERNEKFASLVTLAAGAAHELATPLATIAVVSKELEHRLKKPGDGSDASAHTWNEAGEDARLIRSQVERCRLILSQMTAGVGETMGESERWVPLGKLVDDAVASSVAPSRIDVRMEPSSRNFELRVPHEAMVRALANVLNNAIQASHRGTPITLTCEADDTSVTLRIRDLGEGMSAATIRRVGEPFFTTKPPGEGMGLGLYLTRAVLNRLGGTLRLTSEPGIGTTAELRFPLAPKISSATRSEVKGTR